MKWLLKNRRYKKNRKYFSVIRKKKKLESNDN